ncbi:unnamed protein product [Withania somnifera]
MPSHLLPFLFMLPTCEALDTITTEKNIRDGDPIVSAGGIYEFGFFIPENSKNRVLTLKPDGILVLVNSSNVSIWSSNSSRSLKNQKARLLDSGNLVVSDGNDRGLEINFAWQSFDYPGNTLLPGMKIGKILITGMDWYIASWKSTDDPTPGEYVDRPWNGIAFSGSPNNKPNTYYNYDFVINQQEIYYEYKLKNESMPIRVVINLSGVLEHLTWIESSQNWSLYLTAQNRDRFALCGPYSSCNINNSPPCDCLKGFEPRNPQEHAAEWSSGCARRTSFDCTRDGFLKFTRINMPDSRNSWYNERMNLKYCEKVCLADCNSYSNLDARNGGSGCLLWFGELIDIIEFSQNEQNLFVRIAASELDTKRWRKRSSLIAVIEAVVATFILGFLAWFSFQRRKEEEDMELPLFDLVTVTSATENFSSANVTGEGGFRQVYKGILQNGREIAVKRQSKYSGQGIQELKNKIVLISKLQHRNLVKLLGCCLEGKERMLLNEFMPNASLDYFIFVKSDVFSIGVIILEIVSGRGNRKFHHLEHHHNLLGHAWLHWTEGKALELMDECLKESFSESQVLRCIQVGLLCVQKLPEDRPTMASVVFWLRNEGLILPQPKKPGYFIERKTMELAESTDEGYLSNSMSITVLEPR